MISFDLNLDFYERSAIEFSIKDFSDLLNVGLKFDNDLSLVRIEGENISDMSDDVIIGEFINYVLCLMQNE